MDEQQNLLSDIVPSYGGVNEYIRVHLKLPEINSDTYSRIFFIMGHQYMIKATKDIIGDVFGIFLYNLNEQVPSEVRVRVRVVLMTTRVGQQLRNTTVSITRPLTLLSRLRIDNIIVLVPPALLSHRILRIILKIVNSDIKRARCGVGEYVCNNKQYTESRQRYDGRSHCPNGEDEADCPGRQMNQACTTYRSDFTPVDWLRNNVIRDMDEFCSSENVDECLKYISQEFCALGFPSIYSNSCDCPSPANCDIVKFLNVTHELLRNNNEYIQKNEDLESRFGQDPYGREGPPPPGAARGPGFGPGGPMSPPGGNQQGAVMMAYGLNHEKMNCDKLFNILCLYGNVARVNALDGLGQTALHRCAREGNIQACRILLSYDVDTSIVSLQGYTAAQVANESVQKLLSEPTSVGIDIEYQLLEAAKAGDIEVVKRILATHLPVVNCRDVDGRQSTPLHFAAGYNRVSVVEYLLQHGADVHAKDKGGLVPLHNACSYGHYEVAELLVKYGANVNVADLWKFTPLHEAAAKGKYEIVKLLLKHGADPNKKNRDSHIPLDLVKDGDQDVADLLRGDAALLDAAKKGNLSRVLKLVTPENINCRDSTPLHLADTCIYVFGGVSSQEWCPLARNEMLVTDVSLHQYEPLPVPLTGLAAVAVFPLDP